MICVEWKCSCGESQTYEHNADGEPLEDGNTVVHFCRTCKKLQTLTLDLDSKELNFFDK